MSNTDLEKLFGLDRLDRLGAEPAGADSVRTGAALVLGCRNMVWAAIDLAYTDPSSSVETEAKLRREIERITKEIFATLQVDETLSASWRTCLPMVAFGAFVVHKIGERKR